MSARSDNQKRPILNIDNLTSAKGVAKACKEPVQSLNGGARWGLEKGVIKFILNWAAIRLFRTAISLEYVLRGNRCESEGTGSSLERFLET